MVPEWIRRPTAEVLSRFQAVHFVGMPVMCCDMLQNSMHEVCPSIYIKNKKHVTGDPANEGLRRRVSTATVVFPPLDSADSSFPELFVGFGLQTRH